jgi:hypothetical protein
VNAGRDEHSARIIFRAQYLSFEAGDVTVNPVSLVVTELPRA